MRACLSLPPRLNNNFYTPPDLDPRAQFRNFAGKKPHKVDCTHLRTSSCTCKQGPSKIKEGQLYLFLIDELERWCESLSPYSSLGVFCVCVVQLV